MECATLGLDSDSDQDFNPGRGGPGTNRTRPLITSSWHSSGAVLPSPEAIPAAGPAALCAGPVPVPASSCSGAQVLATVNCFREGVTSSVVVADLL